eukprot:357793-Chlamydomonas_euryale.AAC.1
MCACTSCAAHAGSRCVAHREAGRQYREAGRQYTAYVLPAGKQAASTQPAGILEAFSPRTSWEAELTKLYRARKTVSLEFITRESIRAMRLPRGTVRCRVPKHIRRIGTERHVAALGAGGGKEREGRETADGGQMGTSPRARLPASQQAAAREYSSDRQLRGTASYSKSALARRLNVPPLWKTPPARHLLRTSAPQVHVPRHPRRGYWVWRERPPSKPWARLLAVTATEFRRRSKARRRRPAAMEAFFESPMRYWPADAAVTKLVASKKWPPRIVAIGASAWHELGGGVVQVQQVVPGQGWSRRGRSSSPRIGQQD